MENRQRQGKCLQPTLTEIPGLAVNLAIYTVFPDLSRVFKSAAFGPIPSVPLPEVPEEPMGSRPARRFCEWVHG